jgi:choline dehydrogenase-like flavoprotein
MLGGRTNHFGRIWLRMGPDDFKPSRWDGKGVDWPLSYEELAPYYDKAEHLIGVYGSVQDWPNLPAGRYMPPPEPRCHEHFLSAVCKPLGIPVRPISRAVLTRSHNGRPACHYCGQCYRGCSSASNFSSPTVLLPPALATGKLEIRCGAMAREILVNPQGQAVGVSYIDTRSGEERVVYGNAVVVAGGTCETARLLLNSRSAQFPEGIGNAGGHLGRHLMDTACHMTRAHIPALMKLPPHNCDGAGGAHNFIPWWLHSAQARDQLPFTRGYQTLFGSSRSMPEPISAGSGVSVLLGGGYGRSLKQKYRDYYGSTVYFASGGDMLPNDHSFVEVDNHVLDRWGIPALKFHFAWGKDELAQLAHARKTYAEIIEAMGGTILSEATSGNDATASFRGGAMYHEVGTARMGKRENDSVVNSHSQTWGCRNVFVADGAVFPGISWKNPTSTIMALAWRTAEGLLDKARRGELRANAQEAS